MPSANTGRQIAAIKPSKKKVWIYFSDSEKLALAPSVFSDFYLYVGKTLSDKDYHELKNQNEIGALREYAYGLVAVRSYTAKQVGDRLYRKKATRAMVEAIVQDLVSHQLIDDAQYVSDFLEYAEAKHYGAFKIKQELLRDGISETQISQIAFDQRAEVKKALELLDGFEKKYAAFSFRERQKRIFDAYSLRGFSSSVIEEVLETLTPKSETDERSSLQRDYQKAMRLYSTRFKGYQLREHLIRNLAQKGYNYNDIETVMEDSKHAMDQ